MLKLFLHSRQIYVPDRCLLFSLCVISNKRYPPRDDDNSSESAKIGDGREEKFYNLFGAFLLPFPSWWTIAYHCNVLLCTNVLAVMVYVTFLSIFLRVPLLCFYDATYRLSFRLFFINAPSPNLMCWKINIKTRRNKWNWFQLRWDFNSTQKRKLMNCFMSTRFLLYVLLSMTVCTYHG